MSGSSSNNDDANRNTLPTAPPLVANATLVSAMPVAVINSEPAEDVPNLDLSMRDTIKEWLITKAKITSLNAHAYATAIVRHEIGNLDRCSTLYCSLHI